MRKLTSAASADVRRWLQAVAQERGSGGRRLLNPEQYDMVKIVAERAMVELHAEANRPRASSLDLPGTLPSH